jgi:hypothetical protein
VEIQTRADSEDEIFAQSIFSPKMQSDGFLVFLPAGKLATSLPDNSALLSDELFRFVRTVSQSNEADNGLAQATENVVGCVNDEVSSERWMEHGDSSKAHAAIIELAQGPGEAAAEGEMGCLDEEATSDGRVGRGGGGNVGLGEGGEEDWFQKLFETAIGTSLPTNSLLQVSPAPSLNPSLGSTLPSPIHPPILLAAFASLCRLQPGAST